jgi:hypothetical protein
LEAYAGAGLTPWAEQQEDFELPGQLRDISLFIDECPDISNCTASNTRPTGGSGSLSAMRLVDRMTGDGIGTSSIACRARTKSPITAISAISTTRIAMGSASSTVAGPESVPDLGKSPLVCSWVLAGAAVDEPARTLLMGGFRAVAPKLLEGLPASRLDKLSDYRYHHIKLRFC